MFKYIAVFNASYIGSDLEQKSCITWNQNFEEIDFTILKSQILNQTSIHYFNLLLEEVDISNIIIQIIKVQKIN